MTTTKVSLTINGLAVTNEDEVLVSTLLGGEMSTSMEILKGFVPGVDIEQIYKLIPLKMEVSMEGESKVDVHQ